MSALFWAGLLGNYNADSGLMNMSQTGTTVVTGNTKVASTNTTAGFEFVTFDNTSSSGHPPKMAGQWGGYAGLNGGFAA